MRDSFPDLFGADAARAEQLFYRHYRANHLNRLTPLPGAETTLTALRRNGLPLGVVSSKQGDLVRAEAAHLGWTGYFARIVGAEDGPTDKPAPEVMAMSLNGTGITAGPDVWYVGDTGIDVTCARNAGCTAVIVSADPPRDGDTPRTPDHQAADHAGFQDLLRQHGLTI
jgi:phosphoglycolate phosphatase